jgi:eukaryotic-like serine/threonine-protein kinase
LLDDRNTKIDAFHKNLAGQEPEQSSSMTGVLAEGSRFGVYVVGDCIGHGGMARIYRAEHEGLRRHVALKVLIDGFAQDTEGRERFLREARIAAAIKHPNVVNIFDVGVQDDVPYLVMELLEGEDLEAMVHSKGALTEATLIDIVVPIVAGLAAVHDAGVVHRDLKPGNIFLAHGRNNEIEPKLLDFGISRAAESEQFKLTTARGLLMGTPLYMSPEAIHGGEITSLSDQYSLGVVLYECSTGLNPFAADTLAETVRRVTTADYAPVSQHNPSLSRRMCKIIERAMSLDPSQRFTDLRDMGRELLLLAGQRTRITWSLTFAEIAGRRTGNLSMAGAISMPPSRSESPPPHYRRYGTAVAVLFGVVTFASAIALLWSSNKNPAESAIATHALREGRPDEMPSQTPTIPPPSARASVQKDAPVAVTPPPVVNAEPERSVPEDRADEASSPRTETRRERTASLAQDERETPAPTTRRKRRAAPPPPPAPRARAQAQAQAQAPAPAAAPNDGMPEWLLSTEAPPPPTRQRHPQSTSMGTNNAPIFE